MKKAFRITWFNLISLTLPINNFSFGSSRKIRSLTKTCFSTNSNTWKKIKGRYFQTRSFLMQSSQDLQVTLNCSYLFPNGLNHGQLQLTGRNLGQVFNFRFGHLQAEHSRCYQVKLPNLKLKTRPKQLLGSLRLVIALPTREY